MKLYSIPSHLDNRNPVVQRVQGDVHIDHSPNIAYTTFSTNMKKSRKPGLSLRTMSLKNECGTKIERESVRRVHDEEERAHSESGGKGILEVGC